MSLQELKVEKRDAIGKEASKVMRREGKLPAVLYGHKETPVVLSINAKEFGDLVSHHGHNALISLQGGGVSETAIIKDTQRHPWRGNFTTVDFQRVSATEKVTVTLPIIVQGEPYDVRTGAGVLVQSLHSLEVRALSGEIPESIHVDISGLELNGPALHVRDLVVPAGMEILTSGDESVAAINGPQAEPADEVLVDAEAAAEEEAAAVEAEAEAVAEAADTAS